MRAALIAARELLQCRLMEAAEMHYWNALPSCWMQRHREHRPSVISFLLRPLQGLTAGPAATTRHQVCQGASSTPARPAAPGALPPPCRPRQA